jgi:hypothetical protein
LPVDAHDVALEPHCHRISHIAAYYAEPLPRIMPPSA